MTVYEKQPKLIEGVVEKKFIKALTPAFIDPNYKNMHLADQNKAELTALRYAETYLYAVLNGFDNSNEEIANQVSLSSAMVGNYVSRLKKEGHLIAMPVKDNKKIIGKKSNKGQQKMIKYLPSNPSMILSLAASNKSKIYSEPYIIDEDIKSILDAKWKVFLENPLQIRMSIDTTYGDAAWNNFCGWIYSFNNKTSDINVFTPNLGFMSNQFRSDALAVALKDFKGSLSIYTSKNKNLEKYKEYFKKQFPRMDFKGYVVSKYSFFNMCYQVVTIGDIFGTVTLKQGSKYTGTLYYNQINSIKYINECFEQMSAEQI